MSTVQKIAATVALTLGGLTLYFMFNLFHGFASVSYAQVVEHLRARTIACTLSTALPGSTQVSMRLVSTDNGRMRMEMAHGIVNVIDSSTGQSLMLNGETKSAVLIGRNTPMPRDNTVSPGNFLDSLKRLADVNGKPVERRQMAGVEAEGFRVDHDQVTGMVYADARTGEPIEVDLNDARFSGGKVVYSHFVFNQGLDPALFSLTPPPGYTLQEVNLDVAGAMANDLAQNVVEMIGAYARRRDGRFPPSLTTWSEIIKAVVPVPTTAPTTTNPTIAIDPQLMKLAGSMGASSGELAKLKRGTQWDYLPAAARLGDGSKIVFWYQPDGTSTYKAVYGDLQIKTVQRDQLPTAGSK